MNEFKELDLKKKKYKRKLDEINQEAQTQDQELQVLKNKIKDEMEDLHIINNDI